MGSTPTAAPMNRLVCILLVLAALVGCGSDEDIAAQNQRVGDELFNEFESAYSNSSDSVPRDVVCVRPKPEQFQCTAYVQVRDDVALIAEYTVRECKGRGLRAWLKSAPDSLLGRLPTRIRSFDCGYVEPTS